MELAPGTRIPNTMGMKHIVIVLMLVITASCAKRADIRAPQIIQTDRYAYIKDEEGRLFIFTANTKDFDEAMKTIRPGPSSVDKLDVWVITPLGRLKKKSH